MFWSARGETGSLFVVQRPSVQSAPQPTRFSLLTGGEPFRLGVSGSETAVQQLFYQGDTDHTSHHNLTHGADIGLLMPFCCSGLVLGISFSFDFSDNLVHRLKITSCRNVCL